MMTQPLFSWGLWLKWEETLHNYKIKCIFTKQDKYYEAKAQGIIMQHNGFILVCGNHVSMAVPFTGTSHRVYLLYTLSFSARFYFNLFNVFNFCFRYFFQCNIPGGFLENLRFSGLEQVTENRAIALQVNFKRRNFQVELSPNSG